MRSAGVPTRRPLTSVNHRIARRESELSASSMALITSSTVPSTSRVNSLGVSTTPIRRSMSGNLVGHDDPFGVQAPVEACPLPFLVPHPLVEDDRQRDPSHELTRAPQDPCTEPLIVERAGAPRADDVRVPTGRQDAIAAEQRDADERVER